MQMNNRLLIPIVLLVLFTACEDKLEDPTLSSYTPIHKTKLNRIDILYNNVPNGPFEDYYYDDQQRLWKIEINGSSTPTTRHQITFVDEIINSLTVTNFPAAPPLSTLTDHYAVTYSQDVITLRRPDTRTIKITTENGYINSYQFISHNGIDKTIFERDESDNIKTIRYIKTPVSEPEEVRREDIFSTYSDLTNPYNLFNPNSGFGFFDSEIISLLGLKISNKVPLSYSKWYIDDDEGVLENKDIEVISIENNILREYKIKSHINEGDYWFYKLSYN